MNKLLLISLLLLSACSSQKYLVKKEKCTDQGRVMICEDVEKID